MFQCGVTVRLSPMHPWFPKAKTGWPMVLLPVYAVSKWRNCPLSSTYGSQTATDVSVSVHSWENHSMGAWKQTSTNAIWQMWSLWVSLIVKVQANNQRSCCESIQRWHPAPPPKTHICVSVWLRGRLGFPANPQGKSQGLLHEASPVVMPEQAQSLQEWQQSSPGMSSVSSPVNTKSKHYILE